MKTKMNTNTSDRLTQLHAQISSWLSDAQRLELSKLTADVLRLEFVVDAAKESQPPVLSRLAGNLEILATNRSRF